MPGYDAMPGLPGYMDNNAFMGANNVEMAAIGNARAADSLMGIGHTQAQLDTVRVGIDSLMGQQIAHNAADVARHGEFLATQAVRSMSSMPASAPHYRY